jgi:uncharacterized protein
MSRLRIFLCIAVLTQFAVGSGLWAAIPADALLQRLQPRGDISDFAGLLTPADRAAIDGRLRALRQNCGAQFALVTLPSLEGGQIDDFANKLFKKWGVGEKGKNNGVMLLVAVNDRKARVEVGYELEPILPDALAGRVLDEQLFPAFRQQHYSQGLTLAVNRLAGIIERGEPARLPAPARNASAAATGAMLAFLIMGGFVLVVWFLRRRYDREFRHLSGRPGWSWIDFSSGSGLGGGGGFSDGGGFGGGDFSGGGGFGGGGSGGGGASGGW